MNSVSINVNLLFINNPENVCSMVYTKILSSTDDNNTIVLIDNNNVFDQQIRIFK